MVTAETILARYPGSVADLAQATRDWLLDRLDGITELPDQAVNIIGYGFGSGYRDMICVLILSKKGVKLGLNRGADLPDPHRLLTGSGKVHRFVAIDSVAMLADPALGELLDAALQAYKVRS